MSREVYENQIVNQTMLGFMILADKSLADTAQGVLEKIPGISATNIADIRNEAVLEYSKRVSGGRNPSPTQRGEEEKDLCIRRMRIIIGFFYNSQNCRIRYGIASMIAGLFGWRGNVAERFLEECREEFEAR